MEKKLLNKFKKITSYMLVLSMIACNLSFVPFAMAEGGDSIAPTGTIAINSGATRTKSRYVVLTLSATDDLSGVVEMRVANGSSYQDWETYATSKNWTLPEGDGNKTVRVQFKDQAGNATSPGIPATIILDTIVPNITLIGQSAVNIFINDTYVNAGATAIDNIDGDITANIAVVNPVNTSVAGVYTITYNVADSAGNSAVEVARTINVSQPPDTAAPIITLIGENFVNLTVGDIYTDIGATASDNYDGDITANIAVVNPVNTSVAGVYTVTYNVSDAAGNHAIEVIRTVNIVDVTPPVITLNGGDMNIYQGTVYTEPGAVAADNIDTDVNINIGGDAVDAATVGIYIVAYNASDSSGNAAVKISRTVTVLAVEESQTILADEVNLAATALEALIGSNAPVSSIITAPSSVANGKLNVSALLSGADVRFVNLPTNITIKSSTNIGDVNIAIPAGQISADSSWTGKINLPQVKENSSVAVAPDSGKTASVSSVIEIGFDDVKLNFDKAVRIELKNQAGRYVGYSRGGTFTQITQTCASDTQIVGDALTADGDCKIDAGSDLIIWTKHFTKFITYTQTAVEPSSGCGYYDRTPPAQPKNFQAKRAGRQIAVSWTNPVDYDFRDVVLIKSLESIDDIMTLAQLKISGKEIYKGKDKQYIDVEIEKDNNYYYGLVAFDNNSNRAKPLIIEVKPETEFNKSIDEEVKVLGVEFDEREAQLADIGQDVKDVYGGNVALTLANTGSKRDSKAESAGYKDYTSKLINGASDLSSNNIYAITNFVVYGTKTTQILRADERADVIDSYKSAFGKLPASQVEWEDAIKIANGRWPSQTSETAEANAVASFEKIYLREPDRTKPYDDAAVTVIAYGLRPFDRNIDSENAATNIFKAIYKYAPVSAVDWDIVRAVAYSGATR